MLVSAVVLQLILFNSWLQFHERHRYLLTPLLTMLAVRSARRDGSVAPSENDR